MNADETKFVTVNKDSNNLQLFSLPYVLKEEMSLNIKDRLGFKIKMIAFSHNEKLVIVGDDHNLAVAEIESIEEFFKLDNEEALG